MGLLINTKKNAYNAIAIISIYLAGCSQQPIRQEIPTPEIGPCEVTGHMEIEKKCKNSVHISIKSQNSSIPCCSTLFIEIDDQGFFLNRRQADYAIKFAQKKPNGNKQRIYYVIYVHGWFHGAEASDDHLPYFVKTLENLSQWRKDGEVRGIYIGWRGNSLDLPILKYLTFWDRKNVSEEVGRGSLQEFLLQIEAATKIADSNSKLVTIGHSFGASVVFNSLSHTLVQRFIDSTQDVSKSGVAKPRGYGNLIVLINPAFEAMRFLPIYSMVNHFTVPEDEINPPYIKEFNPPEGRPYFIVLSSEEDWATKYAFRTGRFFSTIWENHPEVHLNGFGSEKLSGWNLDRDTIGNFRAFTSYNKLERNSNISNDWNDEKPCPRPESKHWQELSKSRSIIQNDSPTFPGNNFILKSSSGRGNSPFLLTSVEKSIIGGHSEIGGSDLACWIVQFADD